MKEPRIVLARPRHWSPMPLSTPTPPEGFIWVRQSGNRTSWFQRGHRETLSYRHDIEPGARRWWWRYAQPGPLEPGPLDLVCSAVTGEELVGRIASTLLKGESQYG